MTQSIVIVVVIVVVVGVWLYGVVWFGRLLVTSNATTLAIAREENCLQRLM